MEEIRGTDCNELIKKVLEVEELRPVDLAKKIANTVFAVTRWRKS